MTRHVFRHRFTAQHVVDLPYDPADPNSFTVVLERVANTRRGLLDLGCTIMIDDGKPVAVKEAKAIVEPLAPDTEPDVAIPIKPTQAELDAELAKAKSGPEPDRLDIPGFLARKR